MPRVHPRIVAEGEEDRADGADERRVVAAGKVGPADGAGEQRVADEEVEPPFSAPRHFEAHAAWAVSWRVVRTRFEIAEHNRLPHLVVPIDRRRRGIHRQAEESGLVEGPLVEEQVVAVEVHGHAERLLRGAHTGDVVHVRVRQEDVQDLDVLLLHELQQPLDLVARIDDHTLSRARARDDEAVLVEGADGLRLDYDHAVILAILDDLLFTSKIRGAARQAGATIAVARSAQSALDQMRAQAPSLVILDLNNPRTDPIGILTAMRADAALASIPTVGYVSHVDTTTIVAAREAGAKDVMARSAFVNALPDLLASHK